MNVLVLGLYAEGRTDERFLPTLIQRTSQEILIQHDRANIEALEPIPLKIGKKHHRNQAECILAAAQKSVDYHALVVHSDADDLTYLQAYRERFKPGYELVQADENLCRDLIPIIPVRMVEAWMLADREALEKALGQNIHLNSSVLNLPIKSRQIESCRNPKDSIDQVIRAAYPDYPQEWLRIRGRLYAELAAMINLERLQQVPAYKEFIQELTRILKILNLIQ